MKQRLVALVAIVLLGNGGCGVTGNAGAGKADKVAATTPAATASPALGRRTGSVRDEGDIPDPCTLLTKAEVTGLTGRAVTQVDEDGADGGDVARFCQWQQDAGQLAIFLSRTTADDFKVTVAEADTVDGVGEDAYSANGHLYVLYGTVQIDIYSRGAGDERNLAVEKKVAKVLIPRI